jgi:2-keto-4-pentenoate hydratase/2-oxohepta-3-ene-1,7-dioic acid hydratase in catechol pathway
VIGARCSRIGADEDIGVYIRGYTVANDVTARDLQKKDGQWSRAKGFDTFCPVGPLVTDEVDPVSGIGITTHLNGELRQDGNTRDLIFSIDHLLRLYHCCHDTLSRRLDPDGHSGWSGSHAAWRSGGD